MAMPPPAPETVTNGEALKRYRELVDSLQAAFDDAKTPEAQLAIAPRHEIASSEYMRLLALDVLASATYGASISMKADTAALKKLDADIKKIVKTIETATKVSKAIAKVLPLLLTL